jgi:hypothetical protein
MYDISEFNDLISKIKSLDYDYIHYFAKLFKIRLEHLRSENDTANMDEVKINQGGIRELSYILNLLKRG